MTTWVKLCGKERPLTFSYEAGYTYEEETGKNWNESIFRILTDIGKVETALSSGDFLGVASAFSVKPFADLVYFALAYEHHERGMEIDFTPKNVAGWLFSDPEAMQRCSAALLESLPRPDGDDSGKKKPMESKSPAKMTALTGKG